jgi:hypothetical protein
VISAAALQRLTIDNPIHKRIEQTLRLGNPLLMGG